MTRCRPRSNSAYKPAALISTIHINFDLTSCFVPIPLNDVNVYLRPESLKWWDNLDDFWSGETGYVGGPKLNT
jgi:hypothetical protein